MKININPAVIIYILGISGLMFTLVDDTGEIGSKIPLSIFFIIIIGLGIVVQLTPKETLAGEYGESETSRGFG